jgi:hypothetical protein
VGVLLPPAGDVRPPFDEVVERCDAITFSERDRDRNCPLRGGVDGGADLDGLLG